MPLLTDSLRAIDPKPWLLINLPIALVAYWLGWVVYTRTIHPLAKVPGPFWASVSRTWFMRRMYLGDYEIEMRALHAKHGSIVRIAPDEVAVSDPAAIPKIYPIQRPLQKTNWYAPWRPATLDSQPDLFTQTDEKAHAAYRRIVGGVYSLSNIMKNEQELDNTLLLFLERLNCFANSKETFDFGLWLEMYAYDNIGSVFFGKAFGFIKDSTDYGGYIKAVHDAMPFLSLVSVTPAYSRPFLMVGATLVPSLLKAVIAVEGIRKTALKETKSAMDRTAETTSKRPDVISQLLAIVQDKGEKVNFTHKEVTSEMWVGTIAGADSTSIALRAVFYFLMKNPQCLAKARKEVDDAFDNGILSSPAQYNQVITLPYVNAVVKEATRLFPSFQASMPRHTPQQGLEVCGKHIAAGYKIGMNPSVVQHDKGVFGDDASEFNPERWLESEERTRTMEKSIITFGAGTRQCTGRPLATMQIYKLVPEILRRFEFELSHSGEWITYNAAFNMQKGVTCNFKRRDVS